MTRQEWVADPKLCTPERIKILCASLRKGGKGKRGRRRAKEEFLLRHFVGGRFNVHSSRLSAKEIEGSEFNQFIVWSVWGIKPV